MNLDKRLSKTKDPCLDCGFWDSEREGCACSSLDKWYACPIEAEKPENKKALQEYAEWYGKRG